MFAKEKDCRKARLAENAAQMAYLTQEVVGVEGFKRRTV